MAIKISSVHVSKWIKISLNELYIWKMNAVLYFPFIASVTTIIIQSFVWFFKVPQLPQALSSKARAFLSHCTYDVNIVLATWWVTDNISFERIHENTFYNVAF